MEVAHSAERRANPVRQAFSQHTKCTLHPPRLQNRHLLGPPGPEHLHANRSLRVCSCADSSWDGARRAEGDRWIADALLRDTGCPVRAPAPATAATTPVIHLLVSLNR